MNNGKPVDVVCITEHNMKLEDVQFLNIPNYRLGSCFTRNNRNGGTCILIKDGFNYRIIDTVSEFSVANIMECCAVELIDHNFVVVCMYRVPKNGSGCIEIFYKNLHDMLTKICYHTTKRIVICGDFNINTLERSKLSLEFTTILQGFNLRIALNEPTRPSSGTCIDNVIHNVKGCEVEVIEFALSDHTSQFARCPVEKFVKLQQWYSFKRDYSFENMVKFRECLSNLKFSDSKTGTNCNEAFNAFYDTFKLFYQLCFPKVRVKNFAKEKPRWLSRGIRLCCKKKREMLWKYRITKNIKDKTAYKNFSTRLKRIIQLTKRAQNKYYISRATNKCKATWKIINNTKPKIPQNIISGLQLNNRLVKDPKIMAQKFNNYFIEEVQPNSKVKSKILCNYSTCKSFFMKPTVPQDIYNIIRNLRNTNSTGYDNICTKVIKYVADVISPILSDINNMCIEEGSFPEQLKITVIKPMYKKGNKQFMESYRPVALLPVFSKVFEKVIYENLYDYFETNKYFCKEQKGFRKNSSINIAIYEFLEKIHTRMDNGLPVFAMYMDMTRAFDYVDHDILLDKLYSYGVRGNIHNMIKSYLKGRTQLTKINRINVKTRTEMEYNSDTKVTQYGVPQGSILGPLLFLIYINDMPKASHHSMVLYADDCTMTYIKENEINASLNSLIEWLEENNLKINLEKTKLMNFKLRKITSNIKVQYKGTYIGDTNTTKFLGIQIDEKISWKTQLESICTKLNTYAYTLYMLSKDVDRESVLQAYHGYVASTLRYGIIFWGNATNVSSVLRAQKRCIRAICQLKRTDSCKPYFKDLQLLTVPSLYIYETAVYVRMNPHLFIRNLKPRRYDHLCLKACKTTFMQKSIFVMAPKIYNTLPEVLRTEKNIRLFKKRLNKLLNNKMYYTVSEFLNDKSLKSLVHF